MDPDFAARWGFERAELVEDAGCVYLVALTQAVATLVILLVTRPAFLMEQKSALGVQELSLVRAVIVACLVAAATYFYPHLRPG